MVTAGSVPRGRSPSSPRSPQGRVRSGANSSSEARAGSAPSAQSRRYRLACVMKGQSRWPTRGRPLGDVPGARASRRPLPVGHCPVSFVVIGGGFTLRRGGCGAGGGRLALLTAEPRFRASAVSGSDRPGPHPGRSPSSHAATQGRTGGRRGIRPMERDLPCHLPYGKATGPASRFVLPCSPARAHHAPWRILSWRSHLVAAPARRAVAAVPAPEAAADVPAAVAARAAAAVPAGGRRRRATRPAVAGTTIRPGAERYCSA